MDFGDSADISLSASGSRLLSESIVFSSETGAGGDDLSMSELSVSDRPRMLEKRFSLFALPPSEPLTPRQDDTIMRHEEEGVDEEKDSDDHDAEDTEVQNARKARAREEKLQSDIFILRKMNASFALLNDALQETESANERIARQLEQTDALLNKYVEILSKSEDITRLIFDEEWYGADEDEDTLERERIMEREKARREAEARALAARLEEERRQREEQEALEREERKRIERETKEKSASRGTSRGGRPTTRGTRGISRAGAATASSSRGRTAANAQPTITSKIPPVRPSTTRGQTRG